MKSAVNRCTTECFPNWNCSLCGFLIRFRCVNCVQLALLVRVRLSHRIIIARFLPNFSYAVRNTTHNAIFSFGEGERTVNFMHIENEMGEKSVRVFNCALTFVSKSFIPFTSIPFTMANRLQNSRTNQNNREWAQGLLLHAHNTHSFTCWHNCRNNILFDSSHSFPFIVRFRAIVCGCFPFCTSFSIVFSHSSDVRVLMCQCLCRFVFAWTMNEPYAWIGKMHFQPKEMTEALTCWICFRHCFISVWRLYFIALPIAIFSSTLI